MFEESIKTKKEPRKLVDELNLRIVNDVGEIEGWVREAIAANQKAFEDFKKGNEKATGPIVGYVMRKSKGKADPKVVLEILKKI